MRRALCLLVLALAACGGGGSSSGGSYATGAADTCSSSANQSAVAPAGPDATPPEIPADVPADLEGEEIRYGIGVDGGKRLKSVSVGVSFVVPTGWTAVQGAGGYMMTLMPPGTEQVNMQARGIIGGVWIGLSGVNDENLRAMLSLPIPLPVGAYTLVFQPDGVPDVKGHLYSQTYAAQTAYGTFRGRCAAVLGPAGNAMLATAAGSDDRVEVVRAAVDAIAESARFARPQDHARRKAALDLLTGKRLLKMESHYNRAADGTTTSRTSDAMLDLHADGSYVYSLSTSHDTSTPHGGAAGAAQSGAKGRWWIVIGHATEFLVLQPDGAPAQSHAVTIQNGSLYISGQKVGVTSIG